MIIMIYSILIIFLITLIPTLELRASIPYGILVSNVGWGLAIFVAVISNILLAFLAWFIVSYVIQYFLKIKFIRDLYTKMVIRSQRKLKPYVDSYGVMGLALFIGIPLPGSGVYTGALGSYLLGFKFKDYFKASIVGVLIAATIVSLVVLSGNGALQFLIKSI